MRCTPGACWSAGGSCCSGTEHAQVEFVEIYQDDVRDLLRAGDTPRGPIVIRESPLRGPYCENIV